MNWGGHDTRQGSNSSGNGRTDLEKLFKSEYARLCDYAYSFLGDYARAEDVVQDVFARMLENRTPIGDGRPYLYASVRYRSINSLKRNAITLRHHSSVIEFLETAMQEGYSEEEEWLIEMIRREVEALPPQCKTVFGMSCIDGKKYKDIALELGISVNTVKYHISYAYRIIRGKIDARMQAGE